MNSATKFTIGIDEAGRGALAGPVVVCAVGIIHPEVISQFKWNDSKKLTPKQRRIAYGLIMRAAKAGILKVSISASNNNRIDQINILQATCESASIAIQGLMSSDVHHNGIAHPTHDSTFDNADIKIDGGYNLLHAHSLVGSQTIECVPKGDSLIPAIMAASIVAKVTRDMMMEELDRQYPGYDFFKSKGYPSPKHIQAILDKGPCELHRKTFKRVKEYVV